MPVVSFKFSDEFKQKNPDVQQKWVQVLLRAKGTLALAFGGLEAKLAEERVDTGEKLVVQVRDERLGGSRRRGRGDRWALVAREDGHRG